MKKHIHMYVYKYGVPEDKLTISL